LRRFEQPIEIVFGELKRPGSPDREAAIGGGKPDLKET
jgi:hypothetical protein